MPSEKEQKVREEDLNPVIMKGRISFSDGLPAWTGTWNYRISNIPENIKKKRTFQYTRSLFVSPFLDDGCKDMLNQIYDDSETTDDVIGDYLRNRRFLLLCELSGVYEGSFVFESVRYAINETFRLCYPNKDLQFQRYFLNHQSFQPLQNVLFFEGFGENEYGLFNCSVAVNILTGYIELLKLYSNPIAGPTVNLLNTNPKDIIEIARAKRQRHNSGNYQNRCGVCLCPASSAYPLVKCTRCNIYVHPHCYKIPYSNNLLSSWICDSCMYNYSGIQDYLLSIPSIPERIHNSSQQTVSEKNLQNTKSDSKTQSSSQSKATELIKEKNDLYNYSDIPPPSNMNTPQCSLCPWPGGVLKRNKQGKWVHALCDLASQFHSTLSSNEEKSGTSFLQDQNQQKNIEELQLESTPMNSHETVNFIINEPTGTLGNDTNYEQNSYTIQSNGLNENTYTMNEIDSHRPITEYDASNSHNLNSDYSRLCFLCHIPYGVTYQCSYEDCTHFLHPLCCQFLRGYVFHTTDQEEETFNCYCHEHASSGIDLEKQQRNIIKITYSDKNEVYEGEYKDGVREGDGKCIYNNTYIYDGEWSKDKEHGKGSLYLNNKCLYSGDFTEGKISGNGEFYYDNGDIYYGNVREGMRHMSGTYISRFNEIYQGEWKEDRKHGNGIYMEESKGSYNGDYVHDMREGKGVLKLHNGIYYNGNFKSNCMEGSGDMVYSDKSEYRGMFKNGKREGRGTYTWANHVTYEGHFKNDKIDGVGNVIINNYVQATKNEVFIPIMLLQGSLQDIHYSSGLIDHTS